MKTVVDLDVLRKTKTTSFLSLLSLNYCGGCFLLLLSFSFLQVQSKTLQTADTGNILKGWTHIPGEWKFFRFSSHIGNHGNWKHEFYVCDGDETFNFTLRCYTKWLNNSGNIKIDLRSGATYFKGNNLYFIIFISNFSCDEKLSSECCIRVYKIRDIIERHLVRLKDIKDFIILICLNQEKQSEEDDMFNCQLNCIDGHSENNNSNLSLSEIIHKTIFNVITQGSFISHNEQLVISHNIPNNISLINLICNRKLCSFLNKSRDFTFLLKRKCRFMKVISNLCQLKMNRNRSEIDLHFIANQMTGNNQETRSVKKNIRLKRESGEFKGVSSSYTTMKYEEEGKIRVPPFNETAYQKFLAKQELDQKLRMEAEWAYLCLVFLSLLILFSLWCLRGFHSRNTNKRLVTHFDRDNLLTVKEVLFQKAGYLPMFNRQGPLEEVFVHDCGINTDPDKFAMVH